jgi:hypothetical protein
MARDLGAAVRTRDGWRLASAATSGTGLAITALGYAAGRLGRSQHLAPATGTAAPLSSLAQNGTTQNGTAQNGTAPDGTGGTPSPAPAALTSPGG